MQDCAGVLETLVDVVVSHGVSPASAKMLPDIVFSTHIDVFRRELFGDTSGGVEPMTVRIQPSARAVRAKLRASPSVEAAWLLEDIAKLETAGMVFRNLQAISARRWQFPGYPTLTARSRPIRPSTIQSSRRLCPCQTWNTKHLCSLVRPHAACWICCKANSRCC